MLPIDCGSPRPCSWVSFSSNGSVLQLAVLPVIAIAALVSSHPLGGFFSIAIYAGLPWGFGIISDFDLEKLIRLDIVAL